MRDAASSLVRRKWLGLTHSGAVLALHSVPSRVLEVCQRLQDILVSSVESVGGLSHSEWRSCKYGRRKTTSRNIVDGDLLQRYGELNDTCQTRLLTVLGDSNLVGYESLKLQTPKDLIEMLDQVTK